MKTNTTNTIAVTIFFLCVGFSSLAVAGSTSRKDQQTISHSAAAEASEKTASAQILPEVTLPEVICTAKKTPSLPRVLFDKMVKTGMASIKIPEIRMMDFSTLLNEILSSRN